MKRTAKLVIKYHLFFEMLLVEIRGNTNYFVSFKKKEEERKEHALIVEINELE